MPEKPKIEKSTETLAMSEGIVPRISIAEDISAEVENSEIPERSLRKTHVGRERGLIERTGT